MGLRSSSKVQAEGAAGGAANSFRRPRRAQHAVLAHAILKTRIRREALAIDPAVDDHVGNVGALWDEFTRDRSCSQT